MVRAALAETVDEPNDAALVARFRAGESRAFDELVKRHQVGVVRLVHRYVRDLDEAKDLSQRAFVRAFQGIGRLRGAESFRAWVYQIGVNLALNHLRDRRHLHRDEVPEIPVAAVGTSALVAAEDDARLRAAISGLPPKQRLVLELRIYDELPFAEVALIADCSENAAKVSFHLAVKKLRTLLS